MNELTDHQSEVCDYIQTNYPTLKFQADQAIKLFQMIHNFHEYKLDQLVFDYTGVNVATSADKFREKLQQMFPAALLESMIKNPKHE